MNSWLIGYIKKMGPKESLEVILTINQILAHPTRAMNKCQANSHYQKLKSTLTYIFTTMTTRVIWQPSHSWNLCELKHDRLFGRNYREFSIVIVSELNRYRFLIMTCWVVLPFRPQPHRSKDWSATTWELSATREKCVVPDWLVSSFWRLRTVKLVG